MTEKSAMGAGRAVRRGGAWLKGIRAVPAVLAAMLLFAGCSGGAQEGQAETASAAAVQAGTAVAAAETGSGSQESGATFQRPMAFVEASIPSWNGADAIPLSADGPWTAVNGNVPYFTEEDMAQGVFESYSDLDSLGRCGQAYALVCEELMPTEKRESIGMVKPSGWHTVKYPGIISDLYLYNRCHLIGFQLAGENANEKNLVTGTRYLNVTGMLPFEDEVADHVHETGHHVLYRVTPLFIGDEPVCRGVEMEALCTEDKGVTDGGGVEFHVFAYNVQPGIGIDYATGESWALDGGNAAETAAETVPAQTAEGAMEYALNISSMKFHYPDCTGVAKANPDNIRLWTATRDELIEDGYSPCGICRP